MPSHECDIVIIGAGIVGLSIANQLLERKICSNIIIIEKEKKLGLHSSGRNSGVLHAGIYYKPGSLKAKVCVEGAKRLKKWVKDRDLPLKECGKVIVPSTAEEDKQLDILYERGRKNSAVVEMWEPKALSKKFQYIESFSGRALWSPNTTVVNPKVIIDHLKNELIQRGVEIKTDASNYKLFPAKKLIVLNAETAISYKHLYNCAGLNADKIAHQFNIAKNMTILPFKGLYWQLKRTAPIMPDVNIYPVPDLNVPFLGVHFTPSAEETQTVSIGPTATPALGRENYQGLDGIELNSTLDLFSTITSQYLLNRGNFRKYVHEQALLFVKPLLVASARKLIPSLSSDDFVPSNKVAIRAQLFNKDTQSLEDDFLCMSAYGSTHILNAISPAFTASFALADLILDKTVSTFTP